jgi:hypothetical protein
MKHIYLPVMAAVFALHHFVIARPSAVYEQAVWLNASELLEPKLLRGPSHRVRDQAFTDGYMAHFEIDTDFGNFKAIGVAQVQRRIFEA